MRKRSLLLRLPAVLLAALRRPFARPTVVLLFLLVNLAAALVVVAPVRSLLSAELDHNLYGERMEEGASWRWFDTVDRQHPRAVGDLSPWTALFSDDGVRWSDLAAVSGPPAAVLLAGLVLFLLHGPLHVGYLAAVAGPTRRRGATIRAPESAAPRRQEAEVLADGGEETPPEERKEPAERQEPETRQEPEERNEVATDRLRSPTRAESAGSGSVARLLAEAVRRAPGALVLALLALAAYAAVYALVYVAPAAALGRFAEFLQKEWAHLFQVWARLGLTLLLLLAVKVAYDLAKLGLALEGRARRAVVPAAPTGALATSAAGPLGSPGGAAGSTGRDGAASWLGLPAALRFATGEAARRGWAYLLVDLALGALLLVATAAWWILSAPLVPESWLGLVILFVLHQLFLALRIALRLAHLEAATEIHDRAQPAASQATSRMTTPSATR